MDVANSRAERLLQGALGGLSLRQRTITDNVANASTPGFKASTVAFEGSLRTAMNRRGNPSSSAPEVTPQVNTSHYTTRGADGNNVDIDQQMVELAQTNITYNAVAQVLTGRIRALRTVITEGRR